MRASAGCVLQPRLQLSMCRPMSHSRITVRGIHRSATSTAPKHSMESMSCLHCLREVVEGPRAAIVNEFYVAYDDEVQHEHFERRVDMAAPDSKQVGRVSVVTLGKHQYTSSAMGSLTTYMLPTQQSTQRADQTVVRHRDPAFTILRRQNLAERPPRSCSQTAEHKPDTIGPRNRMPGFLCPLCHMPAATLDTPPLRKIDAPWLERPGAAWALRSTTQWFWRRATLWKGVPGLCSHGSADDHFHAVCASDLRLLDIVKTAAVIGGTVGVVAHGLL